MDKCKRVRIIVFRKVSLPDRCFVGYEDVFDDEEAIARRVFKYLGGVPDCINNFMDGCHVSSLTLRDTMVQVWSDPQFTDLQQYADKEIGGYRYSLEDSIDRVLRYGRVTA